jgi:hypothetical protein
VNDETAEYWRGYRDAVRDLGSKQAPAPAAGCMCGRAWMGVIPPACPVHLPGNGIPGITIYSTNTTASASAVAEELGWELRNVA